MAAAVTQKILRQPVWAETTAQPIIDEANKIDTSIAGWDSSLEDVYLEGLNKRVLDVAMTPFYKVIQSWWSKQDTSSNWTTIAPWLPREGITPHAKLTSLRRLAVAMLRLDDPANSHTRSITRLDAAQKALQVSFDNLQTTVNAQFSQQKDQLAIL